MNKNNNITTPLLTNAERAAAKAANNAARLAAGNAAGNAANSAAKVAEKTVLRKIDKIFIGVLIGILILAVLGLVAFSMQQANDGRVNSLNKKITTQEGEIKDLNAKINSSGSVSATNMKRGDQGPPGIQGPPGPTGGVHAAAGPLLCVGQRKVATPTVGVSDASIIYLDDRRYTPIQYWSLRNNPDGTVSVVNKFTGNCITTNNEKAVFSNKCEDKNVPLNQKFNWLPNMQLSSAAMQNFCLSVNSKYPMSNENMNRYDLDNMTEKTDSNKGVVSKLLLKKCGEVNDINQTWWVGN